MSVSPHRYGRQANCTEESEQFTYPCGKCRYPCRTERGLEQHLQYYCGKRTGTGKHSKRSASITTTSRHTNKRLAISNGSDSDDEPGYGGSSAQRVPDASCPAPALATAPGSGQFYYASQPRIFPSPPQYQTSCPTCGHAATTYTAYRAFYPTATGSSYATTSNTAAAGCCSSATPVTQTQSTNQQQPQQTIYYQEQAGTRYTSPVYATTQV